MFDCGSNNRVWVVGIGAEQHLRCFTLQLDAHGVRTAGKR
jgi:hypothetical protein